MKSTASATNSLDAPARKRKDGRRFYTHLYFSTICGKAGGKVKKCCQRQFFPCVEKIPDFQHFSLGISARHFIFLSRKRADSLLFRVSTFLFTFFPFPQRIFSRISTSKMLPRFFHKSHLLFRSDSTPVYHGEEHRKILASSGFFRLFQLFDKPYNHYS